MRLLPLLSRKPFSASRRRLLLGSILSLASGSLGIRAQELLQLAGRPPGTLPALFDDLERRTFAFFWETTNPANGLVPDRFPTPSFSSIAAVGFGLTAYPIGVERGFVSRAQARHRVLETLEFLRVLPQGKAEEGTAGFRGFFYHFLDFRSGLRTRRCELSTIDTTWLLAGALFCQSYFVGAHNQEVRIRALAEELYQRADWQWAQRRAPLIAMGWRPEEGFLAYDWRGYNEAMMVYVLALGSPSHPVGADAWDAWTKTYDDTWGSFYGQTHLGFAPLFGHQYSHVWLDLRDIRDDYMRRRGLDYFENSRRATLAQRAYAIANPGRWKGYDENVWGLAACDGPGTMEIADYAGERRAFRDYSARGAGLRHGFDDGTIAPTAAASSLPFAPEIVIPAVEEMKRRYGKTIYSTYGFVDAFNPSFTAKVPLTHGRVDPELGWADTDYLGIDQGPILAMIANYRSELVWRVMRTNAHVRRGLERAGFTGGWLDAR
ncbi:MAG TPA: glucoamylase family protein [Usitatibacter sp.]|nr:glucoamylase family protein [Usitatibacter sp.]